MFSDVFGDPVKGILTYTLRTTLVEYGGKINVKETQCKSIYTGYGLQESVLRSFFLIKEDNMALREMDMRIS